MTLSIYAHLTLEYIITKIIIFHGNIRKFLKFFMDKSS